MLGRDGTLFLQQREASVLPIAVVIFLYFTFPSVHLRAHS